MRETTFDVHQLNALALAYMGDAVIDLHIRHHLLVLGITKPRELHREATHYVSAKAQSMVLFQMQEQEILTDEEISVVRRGRNAKSGTVPKNTDVQTYRYATALEALIGYIYLKGNQERIETLIHFLIKICEERREHS